MKISGLNKNPLFYFIKLTNGVKALFINDGKCIIFLLEDYSKNNT